MIINRYLTREVMAVMLAVLSVLVLIFLCTEFSRYLQEAAEGNIPTSALFRLFGIAIPALVSLLLPLAYFLGLLLGYGRMYVDNELVVINACGFSRGQLLKVTLKQALVLSIIVAILVFWLVPYLARYKEQILMQSNSSSVLESIMPGQFQYSPDSRQIFYVEKVINDHQTLQNIFMAQGGTINNDTKKGKPNHSWDIVFAKQGHSARNKKYKANYFHASDGYRYVGTPGYADYMLVKYANYAMHLPENNVPTQNLKTQALSTWTLLQDYMKPAYAAELQWRIALPISVFLMAILAVPLSRVKPRQGRFAKLLPAILIYLVYANMLYVARTWVANGVVPVIVGMWWIHIVLLIVAGLFYLDEATRWRLFKRA